MVHRSGVPTCSIRAGFTVALFFSLLQKAAIAVSPSIDLQSGTAKAVVRINYFDCDGAHYTTYFLISKCFGISPKFALSALNRVMSKNRPAPNTGVIPRINSYMVRSST